MKRFKTITVGELVDLLDGEDPDSKIIFTCDYGDHGHTQQALPLEGELEYATITESAYSHSGFAIVDSEDTQTDEEFETRYIVLK